MPHCLRQGSHFKLGHTPTHLVVVAMEQKVHSDAPSGSNTCMEDVTMQPILECLPQPQTCKLQHGELQRGSTHADAAVPISIGRISVPLLLLQASQGKSAHSCIGRQPQRRHKPPRATRQRF